MQTPLLELRVSDGWATGVLVLRDGGFLTTAVDTVVKRWNSHGELLGTFQGHEKSVDAMALPAHEGRLLTGSVDGSVRLWDVDTAQQLAVMLGHKKTVATVAVTADGALGVSGSYDRTIRVWDLASGAEKAVLRGHPNNVVSVRVSPDGSVLASGGVGSEIRLWSLPEGELVGTLENTHALAALPAGFSPDGATLFTTGADDTFAAWSIPDLAEQMRVPLGSGGTHAAAISPDGRLVAITLDRAARVYDTATGDVRAEFGFDVKGVYGVSFSADGSMLATASADSYVRIWRL